MNSDESRELAVFTEALSKGAHEREAFLQRACAGDEELRLKIGALLRAHDRMGKFLEEPPMGTSSE